jgi:hypothetical protein
MHPHEFFALRIDPHLKAALRARAEHDHCTLTTVVINGLWRTVGREPPEEDAAPAAAPDEPPLAATPAWRASGRRRRARGVPGLHLRAAGLPRRRPQKKSGAHRPA